MPKKIATKFVVRVIVIDPDTKLEVELDVFKTNGGGMVGIDSSFLANTDEPVYSPFDKGCEIEVE